MINYLTITPLLRKTERVEISPRLSDVLDDARDITNKTQKEVGIFTCGKFNKENNSVHLTDGEIYSSNRFDPHGFWFNADAIPSIERNLCKDGDRLISLMHTHPDGNIIPSQKDRTTSLDTNLLGCVVGWKTRCFYGNKDINTKDL